MKTLSTTIGKIMLSIVMAFTLTIILTIPLVLIFLAFHIVSLQEIVHFKEGMNKLYTNSLELVQITAFIGTAIIMFFSFERKHGWVLGWEQPARFKKAGIGGLLGILLMTLSFFLIWGAQGIHVSLSPLDGVLWKNVMLYFFLFILVAINEELISRGYWFGLIRYHYGVWPATIVSSLIFASLHILNPGILQQPGPFINLIFAGILLALLREYSGGVWMPIGLHLTWNFFQGSVFGFLVSGMNVKSIFSLKLQNKPLWLNGGAFGAEGSVLTALIQGIAIVLMIVLIHRKNALKSDHQKALIT